MASVFGKSINSYQLNMKFALVLLGCIAFAAAVPQERGIVEDIEAVVQGVISKAHNDLESVMTLVHGLSANAQNSVATIISSAKSQIASGIAVIEGQISGLIAKGGSVAVCAQKNLVELQGLKDTLGKSVDGCAGNFAGAANAVEQDILSQVTSLKSSVADLVTLVDECSGNIVEAVTCALTKGKEVQTLVESIVSQAASAVEDARVKATSAIGTIETCAKQVVADASIQINKYVSAVAQCA